MPQYFTKEGLEKLKEELNELKTVKMKEAIKLLNYAASFGDLKENAGYHDARDRLAFLRGRVAELEAAINEAIVYKGKDEGKVGVGSEILILMDGKEEKFYIVAPGEANILKNKISYESPLGKKLVGQKVGVEFNFEIGGNKMKIKILEVN